MRRPRRISRFRQNAPRKGQLLESPQGCRDVREPQCTVKNHRIGGYLKGGDPYFDALTLGEKRGDQLEIRQWPFSNLPAPRRRGALDNEQMREAVWINLSFTALWNTPRERRAATFGGMDASVSCYKDPSRDG